MTGDGAGAGGVGAGATESSAVVGSGTAVVAGDGVLIF